jgi:hypothetical protein
VTKEKHYNHDTGLTVQGIPHNRVVGVIAQRGKKPNNPRTETPFYSYQEKEDKDQLIDFEVDPGQPKMETRAKKGGVLWVVINDAEVIRWDNAGLYFMKLVIP